MSIPGSGNSGFFRKGHRSALIYNRKSIEMDLAENLHTTVLWGAEECLNEPQSASSAPWPDFGSKCGVGFVWGENGSERNASVRALLFFPHFSPMYLLAYIARGLSIWPQTGSRSRTNALRVIQTLCSAPQHKLCISQIHLKWISCTLRPMPFMFYSYPKLNN